MSADRQATGRPKALKNSGLLNGARIFFLCADDYDIEKILVPKVCLRKRWTFEPLPRDKNREDAAKAGFIQGIPPDRRWFLCSRV